MVFGGGSASVRQSVLGQIVILVDGVPVPIKGEAKVLGVTLDVSLRFRTHCSNLIKSAYSKLKILYGSRHFLPLRVKKMLCETLVLSRFNYCDYLYDSCLDSIQRKRIQKVQNSVLRFMYGIRKYDRISHTLQWAGWLSMESRRRLHKMCFYWKIINYKCPPYLYNKISYRTDIHNINVRFKHFLTPPPHRTALFERSFSFNIYREWNGLPQSLKSLPFIPFKRKVTQILGVQ